MNITIGRILLTIFLFASTQVFAAVYHLPDENEALIGQVQYHTAKSGDNVVTIAKQYNVGYNALESANPSLDLRRGFLSNTPLQIPTQHLLPSTARDGIVINLPEMRMYYYPKGSDKVFTYPIGIGKIGKTIPIKKTKVTRKKKNPIWIPPKDIREYNLEKGIVLPKIMQPGPDNPLGPYAVYLGIPTYLIHSTIFPESVGKRASFGCIRMYESDIEDFYPSVKSGIPVFITNTPVKVGWQRNELYMEAYRPLKEHNHQDNASLAGMVQLISDTTKDETTLVDWQQVSYIADEQDGIPHSIGIRIE